MIADTRHPISDAFHEQVLKFFSSAGSEGTQLKEATLYYNSSVEEEFTSALRNLEHLDTLTIKGDVTDAALLAVASLRPLRELRLDYQMRPIGMESILELLNMHKERKQHHSDTLQVSHNLG